MEQELTVINIVLRVIYYCENMFINEYFSYFHHQLAIIPQVTNNIPGIFVDAYYKLNQSCGKILTK